MPFNLAIFSSIAFLGLVTVGAGFGVGFGIVFGDFVIEDDILGVMKLLRATLLPPLHRYWQQK